MKKILHIDSSASPINSITRELSEEFVKDWQKHHGAADVTFHDFSHNPPPLLNPDMVQAAYAPQTIEDPIVFESLKPGDNYVEQLLNTDYCVLGIPMYNFSVPASFKAWIDLVIRPQKTFTFKEDGPQGLVPEGKKVLVITSRGGIYQGDNASLDHQEPFVRTCFEFIGLKDITFVHAEGMNMGPDTREQALNDARKQLKQYSQQWV